MPSHPLTRIGLAAAILSGCATSGPHHDQAHHGHRASAAGFSHRFENADEWAKRFEASSRAAWQKPEAVLDVVGVRAGDAVADIGAATGYFAVRFAQRIKPATVWAIDVEADMVRYLRARAKRESLANLVAVHGAHDDPKIPEPVALIFVCNTVHHIGARPAYFRRLTTKLLPGGRLVIVDFKHGDIPIGPPQRHRITPKQLDDELVEAGLVRARLDTQTLPYQYIAIYRAR